MMKSWNVYGQGRESPMEGKNGTKGTVNINFKQDVWKEKERKTKIQK